MSMKGAIRRLTRAFNAKDERAFDEALEDLEEKMESKDEDPEEAIEIHNHIPGADTSLGEMPPEGSGPQFDRRSRDEEAPPWAKKLQEDVKSCMDSVEGLKKWAEEEGREPEHSEDRRHDDRRHDDRRHDDRRHDDGGLENLGEYAEHDEDPNLEMDRRHDDRRHDDRRHDDRRHDDRRHDDRHMDRRHDDRRHDDRHMDRRHDDEANREILGELEFEAPPGTGDRARRARDSAYLEEAFQDAVSKAEVICPGIRLPTFDRAAPPTRTARAIFALRRTTMDLAYNKPETRGVIDAAMSGRTLDSRRMSIGATRVLFNTVASAVASSNNQRVTDRGMELGGGHRTTNGARIQSIADINRVNHERYGRQ